MKTYGTAKVINISAANKIADLEHAASDGAPQTNAGPAFNTQVRITVVSYRCRLADSDGISPKYAVDGLVYAGIIKDDSLKYVAEVRQAQNKVKTRREERTEMIIESTGKPICD